MKRWWREYRQLWRDCFADDTWTRWTARVAVLGYHILLTALWATGIMLGSWVRRFFAA